MLDAKHPAGPWKAYRNPTGYWSIGAADSHPSHPEFELFRFEGDPDGEDEAMAHLIAAAPTLLTALEASLDAWHADDRNFEKELDGTPEWLALTRKAIAQARPKTNSPA